MNLQELKEQKENIVNQMNELASSVKDGSVFNDEQLNQFDGLDSELRELNQKIATKERLNSIPSVATNDSKNDFKPTQFSKGVVNSADVFRAWALSQINRKEYITPSMIESAQRSGVALDTVWSGDVKWDQTISTPTTDPVTPTGSLGGIAVNEAVVAGVVNKLKAYGGMLSVSNVFSTSDGAPLKKVVHDSTSFMATKTAELGTIANTAQSIAKVSFGATDYTSGIYEISMQLLRDSAYDILGDFTSAIATSFGRRFNEDLTNGTGTGEAQGINTAATDIGVYGLTYARLLDLMHSVDAAYRESPSCVYMMSDATVLSLKKTLVDLDNRPLWNQSTNSNIVVPASMMIEGKPVVVNNSLATGTVLFGDFSRYQVRLVGSMQIRTLNELFALSNGIGIVGHAAMDGRLVDTSAIKKLLATDPS